ncbi:MAG: NADH-quinone oxidoreductase subunit L, partial [Rhizobium sp.]
MFLYKAIVFLPLIGAIIAGLFGRAIGAKASEYVTSGLMIIAAILSWVVFFTVALGHPEGVIKVEVLRWIQSGGIDVSWSLRVDTLTSVMLIVVNTVSTLVHVYSIG